MAKTSKQIDFTAPEGMIRLSGPLEHDNIVNGYGLRAVLWTQGWLDDKNHGVSAGRQALLAQGDAVFVETVDQGQAAAAAEAELSVFGLIAT